MEVADGPLIGIPLRRQAVYICDGTVKNEGRCRATFSIYPEFHFYAATGW